MIPSEYIKLYARIGGIFIVFLLAVIGLFSIDRCNRKKDLLPETVIQVDTIYLHDTIRIVKNRSRNASIPWIRSGLS